MRHRRWGTNSSVFTPNANAPSLYSVQNSNTTFIIKFLHTRTHIYIKYNLFLWWLSWIFSSQCSLSHDPAEIILVFWFGETFLIIINFEKSWAAYFFYGNHLFRIRWLLQSSKEQHSFLKIFCNIVNVFTVSVFRCKTYEDCCGTQCCVRVLSAQRIWFFWWVISTRVFLFCLKNVGQMVHPFSKPFVLCKVSEIQGSSQCGMIFTTLPERNTSCDFMGCF